jgi:peptide/nickel transport system substrate-binding protein
MAVIRKRLIFWLIKAYIKKSGKTMLISFILGLILFFGLFYVSKNYSSVLPATHKTVIGVVGAYTQDNLPTIVVSKLSEGLTSISTDGTIKPEIASSWQITDDGKTYIVKLNTNKYFNDGKKVTSNLITYNFSDVTIEKPDDSTIVFRLKDAYSPFLETISKPVFEKGFIGTGDYRIQNIKLNGNFVQQLTLQSVKNRFDLVKYQFYPTEETLKTAYLLGEISQASNMTNDGFKEKTLSDFSNTIVDKTTDYSRLVTLFYNTTDSIVSDKKIRLALSYAMPDSYPYGEKAFLPYAPTSIYYNKDVEAKTQDYTHAKLLLNSASASDSAQVTLLTIKTLKKYASAAHAIADSWKQIGIPTTVEEVDSIPSDFQLFLGDFTIPKDPDQYTLWHSSQVQFNNITKYKNVRIDKLLEDGRKTTDVNMRKQLYDDFQKFLMEDNPASYLYFPYIYNVKRK